MLVLAEMQKKEDKKKPRAIFLIVSFVLFIGFGVAAAFLTTSMVSERFLGKTKETPKTGKEQIEDFISSPDRYEILDEAGNLLSLGLVSTISNFEKNWDKKLLENFERVTISIRSAECAEYETHKDYTFDILLDNANPLERKMYFHDLVNNKYLLAGDDDYRVYAVKTQNYNDSVIPAGKSLRTITVSVPPEITLTHLRFMHETIPIDSETLIIREGSDEP
ncbi:hypothetical protein K7I13_01135 [Brucepastera parasyntrophica]|uniref:hypothetical protein n=1 Tax=Brucepastera parasyntrophica TaxID=2880008 RepID=UPI00210D69EA|nr:hypothetical protein [Brucepastera parasyntrophica]ULQ59976.1 hypothetical protein K7I13_01135 [Brucepastera parasyntrophica]